MICKECGAYNPDHATYCKVCAANLKGEPVAETPEIPEEDLQPTKRFSRPSWVVPEQTKQTSESIEKEDLAEETVKAASEEAAETSAKPVVTETEPEEVEEEPEEELWTPKPSKRAVNRHQEAEDEEDNSEDVTDDEDDAEENEDVYNEEEALEPDDDSFEYEPTPPKRKTKKKKGNALFTILLIAIIVVIVCILVAGGLFLLSTNGVLKCTGSSMSALTNCTGAKKSNANASALPDEPEATPAGSDNKQPNETEATLEEYIDETTGADMVAITLLIPAKATVTIDFPHQADWVKTNTDDVAKLFMPKIPAEVFYYNEPLETSTQEFQPKISVELESGEVYDVNCPSFTRNFSPLSITLTAPIANEDGTIMAAEGNVLHIEGKINEDTNVKLMINDVETRVYEGGIFMYDYTLTGSDAEDITLTASKNNYVTATTSIHVDPYVFVPEKMTLQVKDDIASLRADKSGKLTVTGTTLPGATLTATSDNQSSVFCGTVTVDAEGKFSFQVTMDASFYGISTITLDATKEGAEDGSTKFVVSRAYKDKDEFVKAYNKTKTYKEINSSITIDELLANPTVYATNSYGYRIIATVQEVIENEGSTYVKMTIAKTNETVYVKNMSAKWQPKDNVGQKYRIYCNYVGTYLDTGCVEMLGWFCYNSK